MARKSHYFEPDWEQTPKAANHYQIYDLNHLLSK
jgi:hypothetical protein